MARRKVALLIETSNAYARGLLHGVTAFVKARGDWSIYLAEHGRGAPPPSWLAHWKGDGLIARIENNDIARPVVASGLPAVDVSAARLVPDLPWVETDDEAIARLAEDHLRSRGFRHFAYCGDDRFNWSTWRGDCFTKLVGDAGHSFQSYEGLKRSAQTWEAQVAHIGEWLRPLPRPLAVFACYDLRGQQVLEACRQVDLSVPDEVAVLGVDNDPLLCDLSDPPLSSVIPDARRTGFLAAALLERMMAGRHVRGAAHRIEPLGVAARRSTDVLTLEDEAVSAAVRFIRAQACTGIDVGSVLEQVPMSRRALESRFKRLLGRTPHAEILRVQLDEVQRLLRDTDLPLHVVAQRTGFPHAEYLSVVFKKTFGLPPSVYRSRHRPGAESL